MAKSDEAKRLLRAMSDVDEKYISEAIGGAVAPKKAVTTKLRRSGITITAIAAVLTVAFLGAVIFINRGSSQTTTDMRDQREEAYSERDINTDLYSAYGSTMHNDARSADTADAGAAAAAEAEEVEEDSLEGDISYAAPADDASEGDTYALSCIEAEDIDGLCELAGFDLEVPGQAGDSTEQRFFYYFNGIAVVQYFGEDGELICTIRKVKGNINDISGVDFSGTGETTVEVSDYSVTVLTNDDGEMAAFWTHEGYSYSVVPEGDSFTEDDLRALIEDIA